MSDHPVLGSSESEDIPGGVTVGVLTMELVMLVHDWHYCCTCRLNSPFISNPEIARKVLFASV